MNKRTSETRSTQSKSWTQYPFSYSSRASPFFLLQTHRHSPSITVRVILVQLLSNRRKHGVEVWNISARGEKPHHKHLQPKQSQFDVPHGNPVESASFPRPGRVSRYSKPFRDLLHFAQMQECEESLRKSHQPRS